MSLKMVLPKKTNTLHFLIIIFFVFSSKGIQAQCAGNDAEITICDIADPANQAINLFDMLGASATPGGTWLDVTQSGSVDPVTGIFNAWDIHVSGIYNFVYTVSDVNGCTDNNATVTVTVGGYSGIASPNGSACSDDSSVNLFSFFVGELPSPHLNGTWADDSSTGALSGNVFDATASGLGTFSFTYTMPALGSCPQKSSTVIVTVYRAPVPGEPDKLLLCNTDDMSIYTNLDLTTLLEGEDPNGQWSEAGTGQLSGPFDSFINVQEMYNAMPQDTYSFTYTVYPTNPICTIKTAIIKIIIEKQLDFTGAVLTVNSDICEDAIATATYSATLIQGNQPIPDGTYEVKFTVAGTTTVEHTVFVAFTSGNLLFPLDSAWFQQAGNYTIAITSIKNILSLGACDNIINVSDVLHIYPLPKLANITMVINPVCKNSDAEIHLNGITNWADGDYQLTYNLTGANTVVTMQVIVTVSGGTTTFAIPAGLIPNVGNTTITITNVVNIATNCESSGSLAKSFVVNAPPNVTDAAVVVNDVCKNEAVTVTVSGLGSLTNASINYNLSSANTASNQTVTVTVSSGITSFIIPASLLPNTGTTVFTITSLSNTITTCSTPVANVFDSFEVSPIPEAPVAANAVFCKADNATIANLLPAGAQYKWYNSAASTTALSDNTVLVSGNYFVAQTIGASPCSSERTMITVTVNTVAPPVLNQKGEEFCGADKPTIQDLTNNTTADGDITWFASLSGGTPLALTELLTEGATYYAFQYSDIVDCTSSDALAVTVTLTVCDEGGGGGEEYDFFIPDGFSPNGDSVNDTFKIPDIEFLYPNYTLEIYNRYGNLMFKGNKNKPAWDGRNSESSNVIDGIAPNGVYFYIVYFNKDNAGPKQGRLYLNR